MEIVKIGILGVAGVMLALQFKSNRPEYGLYLGVVICLVVFTFSLNGLKALMTGVKELEKYLNSSGEYLGFLLKAVGITYVCEFCASICKDAGYGAVAGQIEIFGKLSVLLMGIPVLTAVIGNINAIGG
ncbi:SpoIIIAC/SpoIIIAD family protein [Parablautia muri]|uniref:Stage III sporulation protein AD n=1 Tax=Parablautia muri TaxID=2320879 RepID=A0A9X5BD86_9FIRM|nr:stage III sporulation AC/AD family protein [Parablautia muri]NBJ91695.1 stage III sporulation protein AD [Parablautia muri]